MKRLLAVLCAAATVTAARADNWPHWRGPFHDGVSREANLPTEWGDQRNVLWKLPLPGLGGATPVVWGDRIFLTSQDGDDLVLLAVGTDGTERWRRRLGKATPTLRGDEGNGACAAPSTDGRHIWAYAGAGDLACFDFGGQEVWRCNLQDRYGKFQIQFGMHSTPLLDGDRLYLQLLHSGGAWVVALDKATGKEVWKVARKSDAIDECQHAYASPTLWRNCDQALLIVHGCDYTTAHRLDDGGEVWRVGDLNPKNRYNRTLRFIASPVATPELIVVPSAKNGPVVGVKPNAAGLVVAGSPHERWRRDSGTPDLPAPLVHDGLVYLCSENGLLTCLEAQTGQELYRQRLHAARYRAAPVLADGTVYLTARDGTVSVVRAGREFRLLAKNTLSDQFTASPAISDGRIYLRGHAALYAIGAPGK